jgi:hypothetical protein
MILSERHYSQWDNIDYRLALKQRVCVRRQAVIDLERGRLLEQRVSG